METPSTAKTSSVMATGNGPGCVEPGRMPSSIMLSIAKGDVGPGSRVKYPDWAVLS